MATVRENRSELPLRKQGGSAPRMKVGCNDCMAGIEVGMLGLGPCPSDLLAAGWSMDPMSCAGWICDDCTKHLRQWEREQEAIQMSGARERWEGIR